jgi:hypothetical protein
MKHAVEMSSVTMTNVPNFVMIRLHTHRHTDWWERFMKHAVEMSSGAMIHVPSFVIIR